MDSSGSGREIAAPCDPDRRLRTRVRGAKIPPARAFFLSTLRHRFPWGTDIREPPLPDRLRWSQ